MAYPFSEGMYGIGSGIMNMRRPPNWRKRILPRTPFSSYEAAYSTSPVVAPRTSQTPMAKKKGLGINDWVDALGELKTFTPKFRQASGRGYGNLSSAEFSPMPGLNPNYDWSYGGLDFDPLKRQKKMMGSLV